MLHLLNLLLDGAPDLQMCEHTEAHGDVGKRPFNDVARELPNGIGRHALSGVPRPGRLDRQHQADGHAHELEPSAQQVADRAILAWIDIRAFACR